MIVRLGLLAVVLGVLLRVMAFDAYQVPRGDVVLDVGVVRSLAAGEGFRSGFERGLPKLAGQFAPDAVLPPQDLADQHPPLWAVAGAALTRLGLAPFTALRVLSFLCGLLVIGLTWRLADRLVEGIQGGAPQGLSVLAAGLVSVGFLAVDSSGNGSLYAAQAAGVLALVELLAAPKPSAWWCGLVLGALLLLNHQCAVLLPLPVLVLLLGARPGERGRALLMGTGIVAVALACLAPWWIRNAQAFGDPFYSVNSIYFLYRAGVEAVFEVHQGTPLLRFAQELDPLLVAVSSLGFVKPNLLYVFSSGLAVWPVLLGIAAVAFVPFASEAWKTRDRRLLGLLLASAMLGGVAVLWPATKLRYLVVLQPLGILLAVRALAGPSGRGQRWGAMAVGLAWLAALLLTLDDIRGAGADARPERWLVLAFGGAALFWLPVRLSLRARSDAMKAGLAVAGLCVSWVLSSWVAVGGDVPTAYHSADFAPDFFGKHGELSETRDAVALASLRDAAVSAGAASVAGPIGLLAWPSPRLLEVSKGLSAPMLAATLEALIDAGRVPYVALLLADAEPLVGPFPEPGQRALGGRLEVVAVIPASATCSGAVLARVIDT